MALPLILIVDDNPENLTVLGELLQPRHAVRVANSGVRALRLARLEPQPGLILLDVMMPRMDGFEVLRQLRAQPGTAGIPVVFLTALTDPANEQRALQHGAAAYLTKPVVPQLLLDLVRKQLQAAAPGSGPGQGSPHLARSGRHACLDAGMDDHLGKPVQPEQLYAMLSHWIGATRPAQAAPKPVGADAVPSAAAMPPAPPGPAPAPQPALTVPGLTMSRALMYLPGRDQIFERVLRQFANHYQPGIAGLSVALAAGDWQQIRRLLHSLRGACGAIGATDLLARTGALEKALDPASDDADGGAAEPADASLLAAQARQIERDLSALVSAIQDRLDNMPAPLASPPGADRAALHSAMDVLAAQLRVADFAASASFRALAPQLQAAFGAVAAQPAAEAMARHDYDGALLALHGLRHPITSAQPLRDQ